MAQAKLKFLQPQKLAIEPCTSAKDDQKSCFKTYLNFINALPEGEMLLKLNLKAIETLQKLFVKPRKIYARHLLATAQQNIGESIDEFILYNDKLSQNCNFTAVTALEYSRRCLI